MNGKKAKALRGMAKELTPGHYEARRIGWSAGSPVNHPRTVRATYRSLKDRAKGKEL